MYKGEIKDGKAHGKGYVKFESGSTYEGEFNNGKPHGKGKYSWPNGETYEGSFENGHIHGNGLKRFKDGSDYRGEFKMGKMSGRGQYSYSLFYLPAEQGELEMEEYDGEWENDKREGNGKMIKKWAGGIEIIYKGQWKENVFNGYGDYRRHTWAFEENLFENGYTATHIICTLRYNGNFLNGLKNGFGTIYYENGDLYEGNWLNDKRHGSGILYTRLRKIISEGEWINDSFTGRSYSVLDENRDNDSCQFYLFFDTETTGLPKNWNARVTDLNNWPRVVQLAYILYDSKGNRIRKKEFIIKPDGFTIPSEATKIHGITHEKATNQGLPIKDVIKDFYDQIQKSNLLIAHNISFDENVLGAELLRAGLENIFLKKKRVCTMKSATKFCSLSGSSGLKWPKLSELYFKLFNTNFEEAHNASADIEATAKCFWEMKRLKVIE